MVWNFIVAAIAIIAAGVSYVQTKKAQEAAKKAARRTGGVLINREGTDEQIPVVYGTRRLGGIRVYATAKEGAFDPKNDKLYLVLVLCEGPVQEITDIHINGEPLAGSKYETNGYVTVTPYLGTDSQTADATLVALNDGWTSNHRLQGLAYLVFQGSQRNSEDNPWAGGLPEITALVKGRTVYDPRDASTAWSDNAALCIRDYLTNTRYGKGLDSSVIDDDLFEAAADLLDASETLRTAPGGGSVGTIASILSYNGGTLGFTISGDVVANVSVDSVVTNGTATANVSYVFYNAAIDATSIFTYNLSGTFSVSDSITVSATATTGTGFGCNAVLDTSETLFDNLVKLLAGCKGFLPYSNGKYGLVIDDLGSSVFTFTTDHIVGGIRVVGGDKQDKYNQVNLTFADPALYYKPNVVVFPEPGDATDTALLAEDDGERLALDIEIETIATEAAAWNLAKTYLYRSRFNTKVSFASTSEALNLTIGDVFGVTYSDFGWSAELFRVESLTLNYDGTVQVEGREYTSTPFVFDSLGPRDFTNNATLPEIADPEPITGLTLTETTTIANDGTLLPAIKVEWTAADDAFVARYEVQWKITTDSEYNSMITGNVQTTLVGLQTDVTYDVRVRSINYYGNMSSWVADTEVMDGDTTAPGSVSGLAASAGTGTIKLAWTNPSDSDFWQAKIYRHSADVYGSATLIASIAGDQFIDVVGGGVTYYYWVVAEDHSGNTSAEAGSVNATSGGAGGVSTYYQNSPPGSALDGDLWFDTDDDDKLYVWDSGAWQAATRVEPADFNAQNNRNSTAITAPTIVGTGDAVEAALTDDLQNADVSFEWAWAGDEADIDGFYVYVYDATSSASYNFGTTPQAEKKFIVPADVRGMILYSVQADRHYTFGVQAYRLVDPDVDADGEIVSTLVQPALSSEDPFSPDTSGVTGIFISSTIDGTAPLASVAYGNGAIASLALLADDDMLTPVEKIILLREWEKITEMYNQIIAAAGDVSVSYTALTTDYDALGTYLNDGSAWNPGDATPLWINAELGDWQAITGSTFRTYFSNFYDEYTTLLRTINQANVNAYNPVDDANIDDLFADNVVTSPEDSYNGTPQAGSGITTFYILGTVTINTVDWNRKVNLQWNLLQDYAADADFHIQITKKLDSGTPTAIGDSGVIDTRTRLPAGQIVDTPPGTGTATTVTYDLRWAGESSNIDCVGRLVLVDLIK